MLKRWKIKSKEENFKIEQLSAELGIDTNLATLLLQRGISTFQEAKKFFRPDWSDLNDPFLMKGMEKAINRIEKAIQNGEKILIYGDYDVDGTTAVALVFSFFKSFYSNISYYIPDRYTEGYGISFQGIDFACENKFSLIIALDCGIKSIDKVEYANQREINFIIGDHHQPDAVLPDAVAVLNPKQTDCAYPYKELSGCGIGFKLIQAYAQKHSIPLDALTPYLDLVAISIAADIVPITGENRVLAYYGIQQLNTHPREGIKSILELANYTKKSISIKDIVFTIAPRINAAGRVDSGHNAVDLLLSACSSSAGIKGLVVNHNNMQRKQLDMLVTEQAMEMIENNVQLLQRKTTVLFHQEWHKGVIGIVASRLTEKFYKPTILLTASNGLVTGSARSVKNFDIYQSIKACSDLLEQFGGHKYAAGLTLKPENVFAFQEKFEEIVSKTIDEELLIPEIEIDIPLRLAEITPKFYRILKQFAPFGPENMSPVFITTQVKDTGEISRMGKNHLRMCLSQADYPKKFAAIAFNMGEHYDFISKGNLFDICYSIEEMEWNNTISLQFNIKDIRIN